MNQYELRCPHCGQPLCTLCERYQAELAAHPLRGGLIRAAGRKHWGRAHGGDPLPAWLLPAPVGLPPDETLVLGPPPGRTDTVDIGGEA
jgi:hypothetical protein